MIVVDWAFQTRVHRALADLVAETGEAQTAGQLQRWGRQGMSGFRVGRVNQVLDDLVQLGWATAWATLEPMSRNDATMVRRVYYRPTKGAAP